MKLDALSPKLTPDMLRFLCPKCSGKVDPPSGLRHSIVIPLSARGAELIGGTPWQATGTVENLTVTPSINSLSAGCQWHGWIRNGEMVDA